MTKKEILNRIALARKIAAFAIRKHREGIDILNQRDAVFLHWLVRWVYRNGSDAWLHSTAYVGASRVGIRLTRNVLPPMTYAGFPLFRSPVYDVELGAIDALGWRNESSLSLRDYRRAFLPAWQRTSYDMTVDEANAHATKTLDALQCALLAQPAGVKTLIAKWAANRLRANLKTEARAC